MELKEQFLNAMEIVGEGSREFPWADESAYKEFLSQTYYYVAHSTRLLALSASRFKTEEEKLHRRFLKHTAEERSHHLLASHDLEKMGGQISEYPELPTTKAFYQAQYYQCDYVDPTALFGYILTLEGLPVKHGPQILERCEAAHGTAACTFLRLHVEEDPSHLNEAFEHISTLGEQRVAQIITNMLDSSRMYTFFLKGIRESAA